MKRVKKLAAQAGVNIDVNGELHTIHNKLTHDASSYQPARSKVYHHSTRIDKRLGYASGTSTVNKIKDDCNGKKRSLT